MQQRRDEILAKKAKLAELKRQRELRQKEFSATRQSIGDTSEASQLVSPVPGRGENRRELDSLINSLVGDSRPSSTGPRESLSGLATAKGSRPNSVLSTGDISVENSDVASPPAGIVIHQFQSSSTSAETLTTAPLSIVYNFSPSLPHEIISYSKSVQTTEPWSPQLNRQKDPFLDSDEEPLASISKSPKSSKRLSRREREEDEELRSNIRREIEEELELLRNDQADGLVSKFSGPSASNNHFPSRALTHEEVNAITSSEDFMDFVERSSKVAERALDEDYNLLADYALGGLSGLDQDDEHGGNRATERRGVKEIAQFWDDRWSKKRMISAIDFSSKFTELVLASYTKNPSAPHDPDGLVQIWNLHLHDRPEYVFHAQSDILTAKFSPFHPNLIIGGAYSGQVLMWDTRAKAAPVQKTPLTGSGHTHPVYSVDIVGTQNANNIISCSTDGVVCGWTIDMLSQPQELLELTSPPPAKTEDLSPTCMAFPQTDPTFFLVGSEEGTIYPCHRYDRAGAKAGVEQKLSYKGHAAPVMSIDFHPARGPVDLGDLVLTSSLDWSVKLWKVRAPASSGAIASSGIQHSIAPLMEFNREDVVYDAAWSPVKPGVFSLVDGSGNVEVWDITVETEVPIARTKPSNRNGASHLTKSLNKVAWERHEGKRLAVGGLDGALTVFEVGSELGGIDSVRNDDWTNMKRMVGKLVGKQDSKAAPNTSINGGKNKQ